jgi:hypothetical protein
VQYIVTEIDVELILQIPLHTNTLIPNSRRKLEEFVEKLK